MPPVTRRSLLKLAGLGTAAGTAAPAARAGCRGQSAPSSRHHAARRPHDGAGRPGLDGPVQPDAPTCAAGTSRICRRRSARCTTARRRGPDGTLLREYELVAVDREIEIAPGIFFPAWTFNGQVPGPDAARHRRAIASASRSSTQGSHPHTIHFHGWHPPEMDGSLPEHQVMPGAKFVYEFDAEPFGVHLYHCHAVPLKRHMHKGLYGMFIVDPRTPRPPADELVMVMNGFDTNFDADNEVYAAQHRRQPLHARTDQGRRSARWSGCISSTSPSST